MLKRFHKYLGPVTFFSGQRLMNCNSGQLEAECWSWKQAEEVGTLGVTPRKG